MTPMTAFILGTIITGVGATLFFDLMSFLREKIFGVPAPKYGHVGRWIAYIPRGTFTHEAIGKTPAVAGERVLGWTVHYLIGILFAGVLITFTGVSWFAHPTLWPALTVGILSVAAPFFIMQPVMGAGIASSRTPHPWTARFHSLTNHVSFGVGLYLAGWAAHYLLGV